MYEENCVAFKGSKEGISIYFNRDSDYVKLREQLIKKLESAKRFFAGAKVVSIQGKILTQKEKDEIKEIISSRFGMIMVEKNEGKLKTNDIKEEKGVFEGIEEGNTKFIRATIRSGQRIKFDGNVVIIGDVNPGAEVMAEGNILIMGALRGLAHAGSSGNENAFVAAYSLQPTQLRIADIIARSPDNEQIKPIGPELAKIKKGVVVIEPYLPNK
ncbi:septum site-determining protein MinC [Crassaminicella thermophila]|uniref:Probable septum site-determining protein MinC n=1 Tax=Crassaminicella thermophila TaxID=2599308 RepID=A0A5C0SCR5_CRATE|nr:septum site-determining protein MinC [Crassaminicella thermophila]QEK12303.1 septum site-determining protein MinC [Crassaminicella thermophila]